MEFADRVEKRIGPRPSRIVYELTLSAASIERTDSTAAWSHSTHSVAAGDIELASAVAFIPTASTHMQDVAEKAESDLIMGCTFDLTLGICHLELLPTTPIGQTLADFMKQQTSPTIRITVV